MKGKCQRKGCEKPLAAYKPPNRDVPVHWGDDPYCSRECCEKAEGVWVKPKLNEWV